MKFQIFNPFSFLRNKKDKLNFPSLSKLILLPLLGLAIHVNAVTKGEEKEIISRDSANTKVEVLQPESEDEVFMIVEEMPQFSGDLSEYIRNNVRYPEEDLKNSIEGRVICQFTVNEDGSVSSIRILRSVSPTMDKEVIRIIEKMPKWTPGKQRGKNVKVQYTLPVAFKLP